MKVIFQFTVIFSLAITHSFGFKPVEIKTQCFDDLGCFSNEAPFKDLPLPLAPEKIDPKFYLMQNDRTFKQISSSSELKLDELILAVHGWMEGFDEKGNSYQAILKNLAVVKPHADLVFVDWRKGAMNGYGFDTYTQPASNTRMVGAMIRQFLQSNPNFDPSNTHCIGFSLGSHVCGFFGKSVMNILGKRLARITALDPAKPNFDKTDISARVDSSDADFVDVMHASWLGLSIPVGHVDFYVNNANIQPGCLNRRRRQVPTNEQYEEGFFGCSHLRALYLYAESIKRYDNCSFKFCPCPSKKSFDLGKCQPNCDETIGQQLGYWSFEKSGRGSFYGKTTSKAPYCIDATKGKQKNKT